MYAMVKVRKPTLMEAEFETLLFSKLNFLHSPTAIRKILYLAPCAPGYKSKGEKQIFQISCIRKSTGSITHKTKTKSPEVVLSRTEAYISHLKTTHLPHRTMLGYISSTLSKQCFLFEVVPL